MQKGVYNRIHQIIERRSFFKQETLSSMFSSGAYKKGFHMLQKNDLKWICILSLSSLFIPGAYKNEEDSICYNASLKKVDLK